MNGGVLNEAYDRFHGTGPEWGEDQLTNHGPMAVEVLVGRGRAGVVDRWVDGYIRRLDPAPSGGDPITDDIWPEALGDGRRLGDWTEYFTRQVRELPWRTVLATWWPRLLPGMVAGTTHGVIRVGHVVRALLAGADSEPTRIELAHALAFWACRAQRVPEAAAPAGRLDPLAALDAVPRIPTQDGNVASRLGRVGGLAGWSAAVAGMRPASTPEDARTRLPDLVAAGPLRGPGFRHRAPGNPGPPAPAPQAGLPRLPAPPRGIRGPRS